MIDTKLEVLTRDGAAEAFLYRPDENGSWPGVICPLS